jgi:hypothetical protein
MFRPLLIGIVAIGFALGGAQKCYADYTVTFSGTNNNGNPVSFEADFHFVEGSVTIVLTNTLNSSQVSASNQAINGITFSTTPDIASPVASFSQTGTLVYVNSSGAITSTQTNQTLNWDLSTTSSTSSSVFALGGGHPDELILPTSSTGGYPNANGGLDNFNPYVYGSATFVITDSSIHANTVLTSVTVGFGTSGQEFSSPPTPPPPAVPAPASFLLALTGVVGLGLTRFRRLRRSQPLAA